MTAQPHPQPAMVHAALDPAGQLLLYCEQPAAPAQQDRSRWADPFAAESSRHADHPRVQSSGNWKHLYVRHAVEERALLWFPVTADGAPALPGEDATGFSPLRTPVLRVSVEDALNALREVPDSPDAAVALAASSRWLLAAADALTPILGAGLFLPDAEWASGGRSLVARLKPWRTAAVDRVLAELAASMPPAFLNVVGLEHDPVTAVEVVAPALLAAVARQSLDGTIEVPRLPTQTPERFLLAISGQGLGLDFRSTTTSQRLVDAFASWARQPQAGERTVLALHLNAPPTDDVSTGTGQESWTVTVSVADASSPDVLVPPSQTPVELLEQLLTPAAAVWPALSTVLADGATLDELSLPATHVANFLSRTCPALIEAGVTVVVPSWLRSASRVSARLTAHRAEGAGLFGLDSLMSTQLTVTVDDTVIAGDQLASALRTGLVHTGEHHVLLDRAVLNRLRKLARNGRLDARALLAMRGNSNIDNLDNAADIAEVTVVSNDAWTARLLANTVPADLDRVPQPAGLRTELRDYQRDGLDWLAWLTRNRFGGLLADDMGMGKTLQVLSLLAAEKEGLVTAPGQPEGPTLVVVKPSGAQPWLNQPAQHTPDLRLACYASGDDLAGLRASSDVLVVTYDTLRVNAEEFAAHSWRRVVLDEATKVKNPRSAVTRAVAALPSAQTLVLTGTPVENSLIDLHTLVSLANPGLLGSQTQFRDRYMSSIGGIRAALDAANGDEAQGRQETLAQLRAAYGPFYLSRRKADHVDELALGKLVVHHVEAGLTDTQARLYQQLREEALVRLAAAAERGDVFAKGRETLRLLTQLQQCVNHPALVKGGPLHAGSGKLDALERLVAGRVEAGEKMLVFTRFAQAVPLITDRIAERFAIPVFTLTGSVSLAQRRRDVSAFQDLDGPAVYVITIGAGAEAIELTAANHVVHFDRWWNPAREDQANCRAYRPGQTTDVTVHLLTCAGTLEEKLSDCLAGKRQLAADATGAQLPTEQLKSLSYADLVAVTALDGPAHNHALPLPAAA